MHNAHHLIERYIDSWNETDALRRRSLIEDVYTEHARYTDPMIDANGWEAIDATIVAVQGMFPGHRFSLAAPVDAHHDTARFSWNLGDELVVGFDVLVLDADGRIANVYGFLDKVPA